MKNNLRMKSKYVVVVGIEPTAFSISRRHSNLHSFSVDYVDFSTILLNALNYTTILNINSILAVE
jgi:hypothetical protein